MSEEPKTWSMSAKIGLGVGIVAGILGAAAGGRDGPAEAIFSGVVGFFLWWLIVWFVGGQIEKRTSRPKTGTPGGEATDLPKPSLEAERVVPPAPDENERPIVEEPVYEYATANNPASLEKALKTGWTHVGIDGLGRPRLRRQVGERRIELPSVAEIKRSLKGRAAWELERRLSRTPKDSREYKHVAEALAEKRQDEALGMAICVVILLFVVFAAIALASTF